MFHRCYDLDTTGNITDQRGHLNIYNSTYKLDILKAYLITE